MTAQTKMMNTDPVLLAAAVKSVVMPLAREKGLRVILNYRLPLPGLICISAFGIKQALINLCGHAIKYSTRSDVELTLEYDSATHQLAFRISARLEDSQSEQVLSEPDLLKQAELGGGSLSFNKLPDASGEFVLTVTAGDIADSAMLHTSEELAHHCDKHPLYSTLSEQGPEFVEVINQFVFKLPELVAAIEEAYLANDRVKFCELVHNLKGMGGGYGYPQLTEQATSIEKMANENNYRNIAPDISALQQLALRIQAAFPQFQ